METVWFCLLAWVFGTYVVLDGFDFGVGILHLFVARNEAERKQVIRSIGPVWDGNDPAAERTARRSAIEPGFIEWMTGRRPREVNPLDGVFLPVRAGRCRDWRWGDGTREDWADVSVSGGTRFSGTR